MAESRLQIMLLPITLVTYHATKLLERMKPGIAGVEPMRSVEDWGKSRVRSPQTAYMYAYHSVRVSCIHNKAVPLQGCHGGSAPICDFLVVSRARLHTRAFIRDLCCRGERKLHHRNREPRSLVISASFGGDKCMRPLFRQNARTQ